MDGGLHWHPILKVTGVPVPALHASGVDNSCAYMLLERLPGSDLGLDFMGELGQVFNKHVEFSEERAEHLRDIFEKPAGIHRVLYLTGTRSPGVWPVFEEC
jgi:hypothetical protein